MGENDLKFCTIWVNRFENLNVMETESHRQGLKFMYEIIYLFMHSDPSIEGDTPFKSSKSSDEIYCQEISNEPKSHVTTNIKEQFHYDAWNEIAGIYQNLNN